jgi:alpha-L-rhamnosidase
LLALTLTRCHNAENNLRAGDLTCEKLTNPLSINTLKPELSWKTEGFGRARSQTAYQIIVASNTEKLKNDDGDLWNTFKVSSNESINIEYQGAALQTGQKCFWKVRVWDESDMISDWSNTNFWGIGLLEPNAWKAQWIGYDAAKSDTTFKIQPRGNNIRLKSEYLPLPCPYFRKEFSLESEFESATLYVTALGIYEVSINGNRVGNDYFNPGWTDYRKRIYYNTYDVTQLIKMGNNTIGSIISDGWYAGNIANRGQNYYGNNLRFRVQILIQFSDGHIDTIASDSTWRASYGPILEADMQAGEAVDARLSMRGWNENGFHDKNWAMVRAIDTTTAPLLAYPGVPVRKTQEIIPKKIFEPSPGVYLVDMGQNFSGWAKLSLKGVKGQKVMLRYGEMLNSDSTLHTRNLRSARSSDTYIFSGSESEVYEPRFTYHGFRFVEITGLTEKPTKQQIVGVVLHSNLERSGSFSCSDSLINQIQRNIVWSQRSNYIDVPTDCPQRDERMGWTGDAQLFLPTASYNMNVAPFFNKWMDDLLDGQAQNGQFPSTAPKVYNRISSGWGDAGVICPWILFHFYNDTLLLKKYYPAMKKWMKFRDEHSENFISTLESYGDWQNNDDETPIALISTAYHKRCADLMAEMARILDNTADQLEFEALSRNIFESFNSEFVDENGSILGNTQTGYLIVLGFDLLPSPIKSKATQHLVGLIHQNDTSLSTGILGTQLLLPVLTENGHIDLAYRLLMNTAFPSWGHQIQNGASTIWERWDGYSHENGFHEDSTNSFNHYAQGSIGEWFFSTIAGINSDGPGFKNILIRPQIGGGLDWAKADYNSVRGRISSNWIIENGIISMDTSIPSNTEAWIYIPTTSASSITEGDQLLGEVKGILAIEPLDTEIRIRVGSGDYAFKAKYHVD